MKFEIPFGPYHPALHEPELFKVWVEGERIRKVEFSFGYNYREIEKLLEQRGWMRCVYLAERTCGICSQAHINCFCQACEKIGEIEVPERAKYLRTLVAELERIQSHLLWVGTMCEALGYHTLFMESWKIRELVLDCIESITGARVIKSINIISGVKRDVKEGQLRFVGERMKKVEKLCSRLKWVCEKDPTLQKRLVGVGIISKKDARKLCLVGPMARASGVKMDVRKDEPYEAYDRVDWEMVIEKDGDCMARLRVRLGEIFESMRMVRQLLDLPKGRIFVKKIYAELPIKADYGRVEAPRGELFYYVRSEGKKPGRVRIRTPTLCNVYSVKAMCLDAKLADLPAIIYSIDPCFSCLDRCVVIDEKGNEKIIKI